MTEAKPPKYFIRFSQETDFDKIAEFYDTNAHESVLKRERDLIRTMADEGSIVLVEDEKGRVVAASITWPHKVVDANGVETTKWHELGTTRCILNGYPGLFDAMVAIQSLRSFLVEPPENVFLARMLTTPVQGLARKLGWRDMQGDVPQELVDARLKTFSGGDPALDNWFVFGMEGMPTTAKWLDNALDNPILTNKKTGEQIELDFSKSTFVTMFKDEIKNLAARDFGDVNKPDQYQNLRQRRDKWLKKFFR